MIVTALPSMIESSPIHRCSFLLSARFCFQFVFKRQLLVSLWSVNDGETLLKQSYLWTSSLNLGVVFKVFFGDIVSESVFGLIMVVHLESMGFHIWELLGH